ncbi:glycosyltransferase [Methylocella sp.]|uniref:glycosyltransferase n=1 Tax=Methylocella sp. TaxID=1978226 RepID=UPI003784D538
MNVEPSPCSAPARDDARGPLSGRTALIVHPAWHSCGSHQVFVSQAAAYRALGARVLTLALADAPGAVAGSRAQKAYDAATRDLSADRRFYSGMALARVLQPSFLAATRRWLHGDFASMLATTARLSPIPAGLDAEERIDFIHCNHFFCMPAALEVARRRGAKIALDTHDLQARQYALRNERGWTVPPAARFDDMLAIELALLARADALIHLNDEEAASFKMLLPKSRHELIYPAVPEIAPGPGGPDLIVVASANYANFLGVKWMIEEVLPRAPEARIKIYGNIDQEFRARAPALSRARPELFLGRVADLAAAYDRAAAVLLPTTEGHGVSIKTIEAMSAGAPLIATPHAFRGMQLDPARLTNVTLAPDAESFAAALRQAAANGARGEDRAASDTRRAYEAHFAFEAYAAALARVALSLIPTDRHI